MRLTDKHMSAYSRNLPEADFAHIEGIIVASNFDLEGRRAFAETKAKGVKARRGLVATPYFRMSVRGTFDPLREHRSRLHASLLGRNGCGQSVTRRWLMTTRHIGRGRGCRHSALLCRLLMAI